MTFIAAALIAIGAMAAPKTYDLVSPDGRLKVEIKTGNGICYTLQHDSDVLLEDSYLGLYLTDGTSFGENAKVTGTSRRSVCEIYKTVLYKKAAVEDSFNELTLKFKNFHLIFRAYDDGMAYRFVSRMKKPFTVKDELASFNFAEDWNMWAAYVCQHTHLKISIHTLLYLSGTRTVWHSCL